MNTYDYVVVLCPSPLNQEQEFDQVSPNGLYLGGQTRMQAVVNVYANAAMNVRKLIVVGGGVHEADETMKWRKVKDMRRFLEDNGVPASDIICIASEADTLGNFRALWREYGAMMQHKTIGILTNFYHLPRAMRIAQDAQFDWAAKLVPVCAESVIASVTSFPLSSPGVLARIALESKGLIDWEKGRYRNQSVPMSDWAGEVLVA